MCTSVCECVYIRMCVCVCMCMWVCTYVCVCMCAYANAFVNADASASIQQAALGGTVRTNGLQGPLDLKVCVSHVLESSPTMHC